MEKLDLAKTHKDLYTARQTVKEVKAESGTYLYVDGKGEPGGAAYTGAFQQLYPVVYTLKYGHKAVGDFDFTVGKVECLWYDDPAKVSKKQWRWRLMIRVPDAITKAEVEKTKKQITAEKEVDVGSVQHGKLKEGRCLQVMHVGPYEKENETYAKLHAHAAEAGLTLNGPAHEIYLSDPRRTAPEKLKTIIRFPVKKAA